MRNRVAIIAGGAAAAAAVAYGLLRRRPATAAELPPEPAGPDPRAEALRDKLAASREVTGEDESLAADTPVGAVEQADETAQDVEERRREVHERGRAAVDEMQRGSTG